MEYKDERAFIGNYRSLGYYKEDRLTVLGDKKSVNTFVWSQDKYQIVPAKNSPKLTKEAIGFYQSNDFFYKNNYYKIDSKK